MAAERIWIVNGQEMVPLSEVQTVLPAQHYYYVGRAQSGPGVVYVQPGYYMPPQQQPVMPVVIYPQSNDGGLIVAAFLALLILLIVGFAAVLILAWIATGHLPWLGY